MAKAAVFIRDITVAICGIHKRHDNCLPAKLAHRFRAHSFELGFHEFGM